MIQSGKVGGRWSAAQSFVKARLSHKPKDIDLAVRDADAAYQRSNMAWTNLVQTLSSFDREDELLALLMRVPIAEAIYVTDVTFRPAARELWRNPTSLAYAKRVGLLQYWRSSGKWPDFCGETDLPYNCEKEAAKLLGSPTLMSAFHHSGHQPPVVRLFCSVTLGALKDEENLNKADFDAVVCT